MIKIIILYCLLFLNFSSQKNEVIVGSERIDEYLEKISNKSVGLLVNHSSLVNNTHLIDTLISRNINIKKIFTPEHGFTGNIERGKTVNEDTLIIDERIIPIISMYGKSRIPTKESMKGLDIIIFDIQDVGARFYTYISAMHNMMNICAELGISFLVLDRPNPNSGYIDGPVLEMEYQSYIGMHEIPIVHALTVGELATMIKGEKWIENSEKLDLEVIKVDDWDHTMEYELPVRPSPNLPNQQSILLYPSLCLFEQTTVSIGRGTSYPFQVIGHPNYYDKSFSFIPVSVDEERKPKFEGNESYGIDLRKIEVKKELNIKYLIDFYNKLKDNDSEFFGKYFYRIAGNKILENQIKDGISEKEIRSSWEIKLSQYKEKRKKYLLYKDFE
ncbi:MAG: exo-beta-N-acetylmuramidase NamZ domain-containing protein [Cytophagales bacterium]|nr:MAG: hypothetical protein CND58_03605 [Rhodothermaeota bacterium MED-G16]